LDLLDRLLIVNTVPYTPEEINIILQTRCNEEGVDIEEKALALLTKIGEDTSLRYAIHLIITADLFSKKRSGKRIEIEDIKRVYSLFVDKQRSSVHLQEYQQYYLFNERKQGEEGDVKMDEV